MRISNKLLIGIIILAAIIILIGLFGLVTNNRELDILINSGGGLLILTGAYLLIKNGQFINSKEYQISRIGISIILLGIVLKIMHWKFSAFVLAAGCSSFWIMYGIYLIRSKSKMDWTNWLKLFFLILFFLGRYCQWMHWKYSDEFSIGALVIMIILIIEISIRSRIASIKR